MLLKKVFQYGKIKGKFCARKSKEIASLTKIHSTLNVPNALQGGPSNYL